MKRMLVRLGALVVVVVGGFFAIAHAQRIMAKPADSVAGTAAAPTTPEGEPAAADAAPSPADASSKPLPQDPFAGTRLLDGGVGTPPPKPLPLTPKTEKPAPLPRYADVEPAAGNPLRGIDPVAPPQPPVNDSKIARAGHTEVSPPSAEKKSPAKLDPLSSAEALTAQEAPRAELPPTKAPALPAGKALPAGRYSDAGSHDDTFGAPPAPLTPPAKSVKGVPTREAGSHGESPGTRQTPITNDVRNSDPISRPPGRLGSPGSYPSAPMELPRDESLQAIGGRPRNAPASEAIGKPAGGRGISRRDPSAARPGSRQLDGPQAPQVTVQKLAPAEIQVGAPATFQIFVRNSGTIPARDVVVRDVVPEGTSLVSTTPQAQVDGADLQWSLGTLQPGEEKTLAVKLTPLTEGEIGSVATVAFQAEASARAVATRPELLVEVTAPRQVMIGETVTLSIRISNTGTGVASGVVLHKKLPPQLQHAAGGELEFDVGDLKPREARQVDLTLTAGAPGKVTDTVSARAQGGLAAKGSAELEVLAPGLEVSVEGPRRRFLEREATYTLSVANPGTAPATDVELVSHLPKGLKFISANNSGQYNAQAHAVYWSLAQLPEGETGTVKLVTVPIEAGDQKLIIEGRAGKNISHRQEEKIEIEGLAAIMFEVADVADPIEVGAETAYEIRVVNQGTRAADNVQLVVLLPAEMKGLAGDGPTRGVVERDRVVFEPLARLAPKADTTYRIRVQAAAPGDQRVRVQLKTDDMSAPVTKEESTRVFADQ